MNLQKKKKKKKKKSPPLLGGYTIVPLAPKNLRSQFRPPFGPLDPFCPTLGGF